jgi:hypothetical protein
MLHAFPQACRVKRRVLTIGSAHRPGSSDDDEVQPTVPSLVLLALVQGQRAPSPPGRSYWYDPRQCSSCASPLHLFLERLTTLSRRRSASDSGQNADGASRDSDDIPYASQYGVVIVHNMVQTVPAGTKLPSMIKREYCTRPARPMAVQYYGAPGGFIMNARFFYTYAVDCA